MSPVREKFVNVVKNMPYNIDEEIVKRGNVDSILQEVAQKYVDTYGIEELSEEDIQYINNLEKVRRKV